MHGFTGSLHQMNTENQIPICRNIIRPYGSAGSIDFRRKVDISFDRSQYTVKSVETQDELRQALSLRWEVFREEFCRNSTGTETDFDELDIEADHLVVIDRLSQHVVGNYRLISSKHSRRFYSQEEFSLTDFLRSNDHKLELSRSCVHPKHRNGIVMQLLWRGVMEYMTAINARYFFGCTSVRTVQLELIDQLVSVLDQENAFTAQYGVLPLPHCRISSQPPPANNINPSPSAKRLIPPIMNAYLRAGAKLCRHAAIDTDFQCTDFFTILDLKNMEGIYTRKFRG